MGQIVPGIKEHECNEGTNNMHGAMELVEKEMPGFFDITPTPVNRLVVQFTDWQLFGGNAVQPWIVKIMEAGVNMLSIVPEDYGRWGGYGLLPQLMKACKVQRGTSALLKYNPMFPDQVWNRAAEMLS